jgi:hypothetical protein
LQEDKLLNIEQAGNKIREDEKTKPAEIKAEAKKQDISVALPEDRRKYLLYCISLLEYVDGDLMNKLPENIRTMYSGREMADMVKAFLTMKIHGMSAQMVSKKTGIPLKVIEDFDFIAQIAVKRAIHKTKEKGIPIISG